MLMGCSNYEGRRFTTVDDLLEDFRRLLKQLPKGAPGASIELLLAQMDPVAAR